jgi:hypothetical protein
MAVVANRAIAFDKSMLTACHVIEVLGSWRPQLAWVTRDSYEPQRIPPPYESPTTHSELSRPHPRAQLSRTKAPLAPGVRDEC